MAIDMNALLRISQGNPESRISLRRAFLKEALFQLETRNHFGSQTYDVEPLRALSVGAPDDKVVVSRRWLNMLHQQLSIPATQTRATVKEDFRGEDKFWNQPGLWKQFEGLEAKLWTQFESMFGK